MKEVSTEHLAEILPREVRLPEIHPRVSGESHSRHMKHFTPHSDDSRRHGRCAARSLLQRPVQNCEANRTPGSGKLKGGRTIEVECATLFQLGWAIPKKNFSCRQKKMRLPSKKFLNHEMTVTKVFHKPGMLITNIRTINPAPVRPIIS